MGLWVNTTYVNEGRLEGVADALAALVFAEGMQPIDAPAQRERMLVEPMQYEPACFNDLWGLALFPGAPGWTVIQTAPLELLGERAPGRPHMRLAELCRALVVPAFQLNVYDGTASVLVEVGPGGSVVVSGFNPQASASDLFVWHGERIAEEDFEAGFRLLPFGDAMPPDQSSEQAAAAIAQRFGGANARYCDNGVSVDTLVSHKRFDAPGGVARYYAWPGPSRQRFAPLASWAEFQALDLMNGVRR